MNASLERYETIKKFAIVPREFSIEKGEVTPSLKIRKKVIERNFTDLIDSLHTGHDAPHRVFLVMGDCRFRVETNSEALARELTAYFAPFLCPPGHADIAITALQAPVPDLGLDFQVKEPDAGKTKVKVK